MQITVDGKELPRATQPFYFAVNKPKGYLCANVPNKEGTTKLVVDLFEVKLKSAPPPLAILLLKTCTCAVWKSFPEFQVPLNPPS